MLRQSAGIHFLSISEPLIKKDNKTARGNKAGTRVGGFQFSVSSL